MAQLVTSDDFLDCAICDKIWCGLSGYPAGTPLLEIDLGSYKEALSSGCPRHKPVVEWFSRYCDRGGKTSPGYHSRAVTISFPRPGVLHLRESITTIGAKLLLVRRESVEKHPGIARVLDPQWVDTSVVDQWRKRCLSSHGRRCENPTKIWKVRPASVIDTKDACLVPGSECDSYIALSYRWGNAQGLQIQPDTMARLQKPNALNDPSITSQLAPMIRHAISLTNIIGERYLWVDTLCINHARTGESTEQLQLMGAIYANASLTIVALDCDAQDGFAGLESASPHRDLDDVLIKLGEDRLIQDRRYPDITSDGPYHQRGWTYQEFTMSSRRLILSKGSLNWMCQCGVSAEQLHPTVEFERFNNFDMQEIMRGMPDLLPLSNILCRYNVRALTYDEDALPGISGLLNVFSRCFSGGFLYGIPEMFFEAVLSWGPQWTSDSLRRRVPSDRPDLGRLHPCHLPSWSWIGWEGVVDIGISEAGPARAWYHRTKETVPITTWYTCDSPTALHKRRIQSSWFEDREAYKDFEKPLPPGWTRYVIPERGSPEGEEGEYENIFCYPDGCDKYIFQHSRTSEDESGPWHWPFPVPDIDESTQPFMPEQTPYICCDTRRARAYAFQAGNGNEAMLYSGKDKVIGTLSLHNEEQLQRFPRLATGWAKAEEIELVAICKARYYSKTWDQQKQRHTLPLKKWEEYTVLWVEWIDGVAYRLACGKVDQTAWEGLVLEDVSLILG